VTGASIKHCVGMPGSYFKITLDWRTVWPGGQCAMGSK